MKAIGKNGVSRPVILIVLLFLLCDTVKNIEFLFIRTDQTVLAENVICKIFCIAVIAVTLKAIRLKWSDIGFKTNGLFKGMAYGFTLGIVTFALSYLAEFIILRCGGLNPHFEVFITNFALEGQNKTGLSLMTVLICIGGNILNVCAEEGLFRGLFLKLGLLRLTRNKANFLQALLFGVWHIITAAICFLDGSITIWSAVIYAVGYIVLAGILGYEWGLCAALTGTLWAGVFEHFFNNFIGNVLHVVTETGIDEMQIMRIVLSNLLSLTIVLIAARKNRRIKATN